MCQLVTIYTDGACKGNGKAVNRGGWAAILSCGELRKELYGFELNTTNNKMELMGPIMGLEALKGVREVVIVTDSKYVRDGMGGWITKWKNNGWKTAKKEPVLNKELWQRLDALCQKHVVTFEYVAGHSGNPLNERADTLASQAAISGVSSL